jgi:hypothetical protein
MDLVGSRQEPMAVSCKYGEEPAGSKATDLVGWLVGYYHVGTGSRT